MIWGNYLRLGIISLARPKLWAGLHRTVMNKPGVKPQIPCTDAPRARYWPEILAGYFQVGLIVALLGIHLPAHSEPTQNETVQKFENEWAEIFYNAPSNQQADKFKALLVRLEVFKVEHPQLAEPFILKAIVLCTLAAADWGFSSLSRISEARDLLVKSIDINPKAMEASAFITLGNLYFRLPGWPFSFGNNNVARQYLESAQKMYPDNLDSNYFLGDFWLEEGEYDKALTYLEKADQAPVRGRLVLSDSKIKEELKPALESARHHSKSRSSFFSELLPDSVKSKK